MSVRMGRRSACVGASFLLCVIAVCSAAGVREEPAKFGGGSARTQVWHSKLEYLRANVLPRSSTLFPRYVGENLEECEETYGVFPCSTSLGGNLALLVVYGYLMLKAAEYLSKGSELLLLVSNPGIIGGLVLPILGALPDALLIMVSGLSASAADAQSEVLVGMGLLAGSNIMLLTALWGGSLIVGRCDLNRTQRGVTAKDKQLTNGWSLTETGVTTDQQTRVASWIMMFTVLPYLIAQAPRTLGLATSTRHIVVLVACIISFIGLFSYCAYQVFFPWVQQRKIYRARRNVQRSRALHKLARFSEEKTWGGLLNADGSPNEEFLKKLFDFFDDNKDGRLNKQELRGLITGLGIEHEGKLPDEDELMTWMKDFDSSEDEELSETEFITGMGKWMKNIVAEDQRRKAKPSTDDDSVSNGDRPQLFHKTHAQAQDNLTALLQDQGEEDEEDAEEENKIPTKTQIVLWASFFLILGAAIAGFTADPLTDAINNFSAVTGISPFFISFVATPLATTSSEAMSSLIFAMKKKKKNISMTYSQIYGGVTLNNTLCLGIFLAIVYVRGLEWDFSSEVLVILIATVVIGALASVRVTFPLWMALIALLLYPFSIVLVAVLDYVFGWQ